MAQYLDKEGVTTLWGKVLELDQENKDLHITKVVIGDEEIVPSADESSELGQKIDLGSVITPMQDQLADLAETLYANYTTVSLSASGGPIEIGSPKNITLTTRCTYNGAAENIKTLSLKRGGSSGTEISTDVGTGGTATHQDPNINATTSYHVTVTSVKGVTKTASASVQAYHPMYFFASPLAEMTSEAILTVSGTGKKLQGPGNVTFANGQITLNTGDYLWVCVPQPRTLTNCVVNDSVPYSFNAATTVEVTGKTTYNCYRLPNAAEAIVNQKYLFKIG